MDKPKPEKLSPETKAFESAMTREETERAIYIDFEGFVDKAPALIGVAIEADFNQVAFDPGLELAAMAKAMSTRQGDQFIGELRAKALKEKRRIVAYSQHEKRVCRKFYGIDLSPVYADARLIAMKWRKKTHPGMKPRPKSLKEYLRLIRYERGNYLGEKQSTQRIRAVRDMLAKRGSSEALTKTVKGKWTKVLQNNRSTSSACVNCAAEQCLGNDGRNIGSASREAL